MEAIDRRLKTLQDDENKTIADRQMTLMTRTSEDDALKSKRELEDNEIKRKREVEDVECNKRCTERDQEADELMNKERRLRADLLTLPAGRSKMNLLSPARTQSPALSKKFQPIQAKTKKRAKKGTIAASPLWDGEGRTVWLHPLDRKLVYLQCPIPGCEKMNFTSIRNLKSHVSNKNHHNQKGLLTTNDDVFARCSIPVPGQDPNIDDEEALAQLVSSSCQNSSSTTSVQQHPTPEAKTGLTLLPKTSSESPESSEDESIDGYVQDSIKKERTLRAARRSHLSASQRDHSPERASAQGGNELPITARVKSEDDDRNVLQSSEDAGDTDLVYQHDTHLTDTTSNCGSFSPIRREESFEMQEERRDANPYKSPSPSAKQILREIQEQESMEAAHHDRVLEEVMSNFASANRSLITDTEPSSLLRKRAASRRSARSESLVSAGMHQCRGVRSSTHFP